MKTIFYGIVVICLATFFTNCSSEGPFCPGCSLQLDNSEKLILNYPKTSYPGSQVLVTIDFIDMGGEQIADIKWLADEYPRPEQVRKTESITPTHTGSYQFTFPTIQPDSYYYVRCVVIPLNTNIAIEKIIRIHYPN